MTKSRNQAIANNIAILGQRGMELNNPDQKSTQRTPWRVQRLASLMPACTQFCVVGTSAQAARLSLQAWGHPSIHRSIDRPRKY